MAIEFRCDGCQRLLRVPDDAAGKQAKCPECGRMLIIPEAGAAVGPPAPQPAPDQPVNPYQSPGAVAPYEPGQESYAQTPFQPTRIEAGEIIGRTWRIFTERIAECFLSMLCFFGGMLGIVLVFIIAAVILGLVLWVALGDAAVLPIILVVLLTIIGVALGSAWLQAGWLLYLLKLARGQPVVYSEVFSGKQYILPFFFVSLAYYTIVFMGLLLCVVPGIFISLIFLPCMYLVVDRDSAIGTSFSLSLRATQGNVGALFLLWLFQFGVSMLAVFVPGGSIIITPYFVVMWVVAYLAMTGQPTIGREGA